MKEVKSKGESDTKKNSSSLLQLCSHLQHLVWGGLNAGRHVGWAVCSLLHIHEIVGWILVQHDLTDWDQWEVSMGPDLWV